jgi:hypothetical protein
MEHFYKKIHGWSRFIPFYRDAVAEAKNGAVFVGVGAWKGKSAAFMGVSILNSGKDIKFTVVDTWEGSDEPAHHQDIDVQNGTLYETFLKNIEPVDSVVIPLRMESVKAAEQFEDGTIDFLLLDAAHDYENVKADLAAWWPKIKPDGVMAGDDYKWGGVNKAVTEFFGTEEWPVDNKNSTFDTLRGVCWRVRKCVE